MAPQYMRKCPKHVPMDKKLACITRIQKGEQTRKEAAIEMGVDLSTIGRWIRDSKKWKSLCHKASPKKFKFMRAPKYPDLEEALLLWVNSSRAINKSIPVTYNFLFAKAQE